MVSRPPRRLRAAWHGDQAASAVRRRRASARRRSTFRMDLGGGTARVMCMCVRSTFFKIRILLRTETGQFLISQDVRSESRPAAAVLRFRGGGGEGQVFAFRAPAAELALRGRSCCLFLHLCERLKRSFSGVKSAAPDASKAYATGISLDDVDSACLKQIKYVGRPLQSDKSTTFKTSTSFRPYFHV